MRPRPQLVANKVLVPIDDGAAVPHLIVDSSVRLEQEQMVPAGLAPELGQHTEAMLSELGFDTAGIEALRAAGAIPRSQ